MNALPQANTAFQRSTTTSLRDQSNISTLPLVGARIRVQSSQNSWARVLNDRLNELTSLPVGWDGYAGTPVRFQCAYFAQRLLETLYVEDVPPPALVPGGDGTLQLEWHRNNFDIEVDVLGPYDVRAVRRNVFSDQEPEELEFTEADFTTLYNWIAALQSANMPRVRKSA